MRLSTDFAYTRVLGDILVSPRCLAAFESYLQEVQAHENLLFIEALSRLKCEQNVMNIECAVERIWRTFVAKGAPMEVNITCYESTKQLYEASQYTLLDTEKALRIFKKAEIEICQLLQTRVEEFKRSSHMLSRFTLHCPKQSQKKVVIVGGGFVGFTVASILDPMSRFHVTLIDAKDSFEYTPGMIKMLVRPETSSSLRVRHDAYVKNGRVVIGVADRLEKDATMIHVNNQSISFDYLVIATGSTYQSKLKSFDISALYRMSELGAEYTDLKMAKNVLIIGGGLVGCELASEIALHEFPDGHPKKKSVTVIESHSSLVRRFDPSRQKKAMDYLRSLGVNVICNEKIVDFNSGGNSGFLGSSGQVYKNFDKVYLATGTTPCCELLKNADEEMDIDFCVDNWGRICVKPTLQLNHWKYQHIFAGGDVTNVKEEKTGYAATLAGVCIARNICRMEKGKKPLEQGTGGTLPAPLSPLHGKDNQGGIGRKHLSSWQKTFAFLHPNWAALKYFEEKEFLQIVAGEANPSMRPIGKLPKPLDDVITKHDPFRIYHHYHHHSPRHSDESHSTASSTTNLSGYDVLSSAAAEGDSVVDLRSNRHSTHYHFDEEDTFTNAATFALTASSSASSASEDCLQHNEGYRHHTRTPSPDTSTFPNQLSMEDIYEQTVSELKCTKLADHARNNKHKHHGDEKDGQPLNTTQQLQWQHHPFGVRKS